VVEARTPRLLGDRHVYVHSVTDGSTGAVSDADIAKQIQVLNNGFTGQEGGYPTGFTVTT